MIFVNQFYCKNTYSVNLQILYIQQFCRLCWPHWLAPYEHFFQTFPVMAHRKRAWFRIEKLRDRRNYNICYTKSVVDRISIQPRQGQGVDLNLCLRRKGLTPTAFFKEGSQIFEDLKFDLFKLLISMATLILIVRMSL
jgi:hypothetical protein